MSVGRIRSIKPSFPADETLGQCSRDARLLFACLWATCCDDHGRFRAAPALVRGAVFPYDDNLDNASVELLLKELEVAGRLELYEVAGQRYGYVVNWAKHQRISNAGVPDFPDPPSLAASCGEPPQVAATFGDSPLERKGKDRRGEDSPQLTSVTEATSYPSGFTPEQRRMVASKAS